jgi:hypothetical protein
MKIIYSHVTDTGKKFDSPKSNEVILELQGKKRIS